jgi:predicted nucleic acid-binding protein
VVGTLGLLGRAKELGLVPAVRPFVEALQVGGWYDAAIIERFLSAMGE